MRELTEEDILFEDFIKNDDEEALVRLLESINDSLFAIVVSFVGDNETAENVLDEVIEEFIRKKNECNISKIGVFYFIYLIAKEKMFRFIK